MKKWILVLLVGIMFLVGFIMNNLNLSSSEEGKVNVESEVSQGDFKLKLVSSKSIYNKAEEIKIFAGIKYTGEKEQIKIQPMSYPFLFDVKEHTRNVKIDGINLVTGDSITLNKNKWYMEPFEKSGTKTKEQFIQEFFSDDGFPTGDYTITVRPAFSVESRLINDLSTQINIKVVNDTN